MKKCLKEFSQELNIIQNKKKDWPKKFDSESKGKLLNEIKAIRDRAAKIVFYIFRNFMSS